MRTFILCSALLLFSQIMLAQTDIAYLIDQKASTPSKEQAEPKKNLDLFLAHNLQATNTLRQHFLRKIRYPEILQQYGFEGAGMIEVSISGYGKIEDISIVQSISPLFDQAIMEAMESLDYVMAKGQKYEGWRKIRIPVSFSMR